MGIGAIFSPLFFDPPQVSGVFGFILSAKLPQLDRYGRNSMIPHNYSAQAHPTDNLVSFQTNCNELNSESSTAIGSEAKRTIDRS